MFFGEVEGEVFCMLSSLRETKIIETKKVLVHLRLMSILTIELIESFWAEITEIYNILGDWGTSVG